MSEPLKPSPALLCKLGSIVVHVDEMLSITGHDFDKIALEELLKDSDVAEWLGQMDGMAMLPKKRTTEDLMLAAKRDRPKHK